MLQWLAEQTRRLTPIRRFLMLILAGFLVAFAGLLAPPTHTSLEQWFVIAAGITNWLAIWDLPPKALQKTRQRWIRILLTCELIFFSAVLGVDIHLALGGNELVLAFAVGWVVLWLLYVAASPDPNEKLHSLVSVLLIAASLYLFPSVLKYLGQTHCVSNLFEGSWWWPFARPRLYAWVHLLIIPLVYCFVDCLVAWKDKEWEKYRVLDMTLLGTGLACTLSGWFYAILGPSPKSVIDAVMTKTGFSAEQVEKVLLAAKDVKGTEPLYEAGAAAVILLLGNLWYEHLKQE